MYTRYTEDDLKRAVAQSISWADVCRFFNKPHTGGSRGHLQRRIRSLGISTAHFITEGRGRGWAKGVLGRCQKSAEQILCRDTTRTRPPAPFLLRRALLEVGVPYVCAQCGNPPVWQGSPLVLQVDHRSGDRADNRPENLRFLCPNCHSQTHNWGRRA